MIAVHEVTKRFGATPALDAVSLEVRPGTTHVLLGSSGSGKSTVLRLILGLIWPDAGSVRVDGTPVEPGTRDGLLARMGYVVQDGGLYPHLTAFDNVALAIFSREGKTAHLGTLAHLDHAVVGKRQRAFQHVFEFAHIAGKGIGVQSIEHLRSERGLLPRPGQAEDGAGRVAVDFQQAVVRGQVGVGVE